MEGSEIKGDNPFMGLGPRKTVTFLAGTGALAVCLFTGIEWLRAAGPGRLKIQTRRELEGKYYLGDGLGMNCQLILSDEGTFRFQRTGCVGVYDRNEGSYRLEQDILVLSPKGPKLRKGFRGVATCFLPVKWGDRQYVITESELGRFLEEVERGKEPRNGAHGSFYLRQGDEKKAVSGAPDLRQEWRDGLLKKKG